MAWHRNLLEWRKTYRRAGQNLAAIGATRARGLWPEPGAALPDWAGRKVLLIRHDLLGDTMLTVPFLERLLAAECEACVFTESSPARVLLESLGVRAHNSLEDLGGWNPDVVLFLKPCRNYRAARHPYRWQRLEEVLERFRGALFVIPAMRARESMSVHLNVYGRNPFHRTDALTLLSRYADGLGLPPSRTRLFEQYRRDPTGGVAVNLSAGQGQVTDRRHIETEQWVKFHRRLRPHLRRPVAFVFMATDTTRARELEERQQRGDLGDAELHAPPDIVATAHWLAGRRLLVSPDSGLCHVARNLEIPMVVATPEKLTSYWYPDDGRTRLVLAKYGHDLDGEELATATLRHLESSSGLRQELVS